MLRTPKLSTLSPNIRRTLKGNQCYCDLLTNKRKSKYLSNGKTKYRSQICRALSCQHIKPSTRRLSHSLLSEILRNKRLNWYCQRNQRIRMKAFKKWQPFWTTQLCKTACTNQILVTNKNNPSIKASIKCSFQTLQSSQL